MATDNFVTGKKYRILTDKVNKAWDVISFWTAAKDVTVEATGNNAEQEFSQIRNKVSAVDNLTVNNLNAPAWDSTKKYSKGDLVSYNSSIWSCKINMSAPESWIPEHWELVTSIPFKFGISPEGKYGYIKVGADSVTPFSSNNFEADLMMSNSSWSSTNTYESNYTFTQDYDSCYLVLTGVSKYYFKVSGKTFQQTISVSLNGTNMNSCIAKGQPTNSIAAGEYAATNIVIYHLEDVKANSILHISVTAGYEVPSGEQEGSYRPVSRCAYAILGV